MAAFFSFVLLGIHAPDGHRMPHTQNFRQAPSTAMIDKHYGHLRHDQTRARLDAVSMV
jgi:hypothetical protein